MMDVTIHQLQCFDAVVSEGTFQAAADKLLRAQPSVSLAVKNLEAQLKVNLLDRSGYRVSLTLVVTLMMIGSFASSLLGGSLVEWRAFLEAEFDGVGAAFAHHQAGDLRDRGLELLR